VFLFLLEQQQTAVGGKVHGVGRSLQLEVFDWGEMKFL
jgi:hypothetical protein